MKTYGMDDAKVIIRNFEEKWVEFKTDGVHLNCEMLEYDPPQILHWKYVCELEDLDAPNPLSAPGLPFPFTANELAAFMLDGVGAVIASRYGNWEDGPDQAMLESMGVLAREPRRAITGAYAAYMAAQAKVGKYPAELEMRTDRLRKIYNYRNLKANTREGVFARGIDRDEANARRARAVASNAEIEKLYDLATNDYQAASGAWRKAMVNELLKPAPAQTPATPAPGMAASNGPAPLTTNEIANCFAGLRGWDVERWTNELGSPDGWLKGCQHRPGTRGRGGHQSTWFPVLIGAALVERFDVPAKSVSAIFKRTEPLAQWRDSWEPNDPDSF